jgi:hypothetical protein
MDRLAGAVDSPDYSNAHSRTPQSCRWGQVTLFLPFPEWLDAWDSPWTCRHPGHKGPLKTAETCATCPDWTLREHPAAR